MKSWGRGPLVGALIVGLAIASAAGWTMAQGGGAPLHRAAPSIAGGPWINSPPLTIDALRGRVVFVEFWTYG